MERKPKILRILLSISESSGPFNQFTYPFGSLQEISLCLLKEPKMAVSDDINLINANGSLRKFFLNIWRESYKNYDLVHIHHANLSLAIIFFLRFRNARKTIFTLGTCFENLKFRHRVLLFLSRTFFSNFVCCSEAVYRSIPEWFQSANMSVIRHGINLKRVHSGRKSNVIFVATRIIRQKNIDSIIRGFAGSSHLHSYKLVVAGEGNMRVELQDFVKNLDLADRVEFLGPLPRAEVLLRMSESRFYISASESDGMPIAVLEAVASGSIPLLLKTSPHLEVLNQGIHGFSFCDMKNDIANLIGEVTGYDKKELDKQSKANIEISNQKFGTDTMMKNYMEL